MKKWKNDMTKDDNSLVYSIEEAGAKLGLGRNSAYSAAQNGDIPTIRVGRLIKVPKAALDRLLGIQQEAAAASTPAAPLPPQPQHQPQEVFRLKPIRKVLRQEPRVQVNLALAVELNNKLVQSAEARGLSLSGEIRERLIRSIEEDEARQQAKHKE